VALALEYQRSCPTCPSLQLDDDDAALATLVGVFATLRGTRRSQRQGELRLLVPLSLPFLPFANLFDDERRQHGGDLVRAGENSGNNTKAAMSRSYMEASNPAPTVK